MPIMPIWENELYKQIAHRAEQAFKSSIVYSENNSQADAFLEGEGFTDPDSKIKLLQELFHIEIISSTFGSNGPKPINDYEAREINYWDLLTMIRFKKKQSVPK